MTDDFDNYLKKRELRRDELSVLVNAHNREVLFSALPAAAIHTVEVELNGCGDEGQIDSIVCHDSDGKEMEFPLTAVTVQVIEGFPDLKVTDKIEPLDEAIETVCYEYLRQTYDGWENSDGEVDGAFGAFKFDVANKTIKLDFNQRVIESINSTLEF